MKLVKLLSLHLVVQLLCLGAANAYELAGEGVGPGVSIDLDFAGASFLLVKTPQQRADLKLTLIDAISSEKLWTANFSGHKGLEEYLLVNKTQCERCIVSLQGVAEIDRNSPYSVSVNPIHNDEDLEDVHNRIELLTKISHAAIARGKADDPAQNDREKYLRESANLLTQVSEASSNNLELHLFSLTMLGETLFYLGDYDEHRLVLQNILVASRGEPSPYLANAFYGLGGIEADTKKEAAFYDQGMQVAESIRDDLLFAKGSNYKSVNRVNVGRFDEAFTLLDHAYRVNEERKAWRAVLDNLHNLSWGHMRAGKLSKSLALAQEQVLLAKSFQHDENRLWGLYNLGLAYGQLGERFLADNYIDEALRDHAKLPERKRTTLGALKAYLLHDKTKRHLEYGSFELAADLAQKTKVSFKEQSWPSSIAKIEYMEGEIALSQKKNSLARANFDNALEFFRANKMPGYAASSYLQLSRLDMSNFQLAEAANNIVNAFEQNLDTDDFTQRAKLLSQAVELLVRLGDAEEAFELITESDPIIDKHGAEHDQVEYLYRKAMAAKALDNKDQALELLRVSRMKIETALPKIKQKNLRRTYLSTQKKVFELSMEIALSSPKKNLIETINLAESFRAQTLREGVDKFSFDSQIDPALLNQRDKLLAEISSFAVEWYKRESSHGTNLKALRALTNKLERVEAEISEIDKVAPPKRISSSFKLEDISPDELVLYYFLGADKSWMWAITRNSIEVYNLPSESAIESAVAHFNETISTSPLLDRQNSSWERREAIRTVSAILLSSVSDKLSNADFKNITIVPDGSLHSVSFAALYPDEASQQWLVESYSLSYTTSLSLRKSLQRRSALKPDRFTPKALIVADPTLDEASSSFSSLPMSAIEAKRVKEYLGNQATVLTAEDARKESVLKSVSDATTILHFATHGFMNNEESSLSGLVFSESSRGSNRWLAPEISSTQIGAKLVVLSACESVVGPMIAGEGLLGLSRYFLEAGADQVLGTLWKVQDDTSLELMERFYFYLTVEGEDVASALTKAQVELIQNKDQDWADPYYWAGFRVQGIESEATRVNI